MFTQQRQFMTEIVGKLKENIYCFLNIINIKHQSRLKALQKFYFSNVIFRPHWLKPFSNSWKYDAKSSLNTNMTSNFNVVFSFFEQKFPRICPNKVPIVSVQHILSVFEYHHINFQWFPQLPIKIPIFHGESFGGVISRNSRGIPLFVRLL